MFVWQAELQIEPLLTYIITLSLFKSKDIIHEALIAMQITKDNIEQMLVTFKYL